MTTMNTHMDITTIKAGDRVKTTVSWAGVPANTIGTVIGHYQIGHVPGVSIRWDGVGYVDGFNKAEVERYITWAQEEIRR
jgi:hypothetical protein